MEKRYLVEPQPVIHYKIKDVTIHSEAQGRIWYLKSTGDGIHVWAETRRLWQMPEPMIADSKPDSIEYWREVHPYWKEGYTTGLEQIDGLWYWTVEDNIRRRGSMPKQDKLSATQLRVLRQLYESDDWMTAYALKCSMSTLYSLSSRRNYVTRGPMRLGDIFSPQTNIEWQITTIGKDFLHQLNSEVTK